MSVSHYIIFHPDKAREKAEVQATALINGVEEKNWNGQIWVDGLEGNQDPYVFNSGWLYSYCHATQLRRKPGHAEGWVQSGSWLFFCSGDKADQGNLVVDTVFLVAESHPWVRSKQPDLLNLPIKFQDHYEDSSSRLWNEHFCFPFQDQHCSVTYTYEATLWSPGRTIYSFLPYSKPEVLVNIPFSQLSPPVSQKLTKYRNGKYPIPLTDHEAINLVTRIKNMAEIQVVGGIKHLGNPVFSDAGCDSCTPSRTCITC